MENGREITEYEYRSFIVLTSKDELLKKLLMHKEFNDNAQLIDSISLIMKYGNKAFLINKVWLHKQIENEQLS
jgi:intein/homing endonuclease